MWSPSQIHRSSSLGATLPDRVHCSFMDNLFIKGLPILDLAIHLRKWILVPVVDGLMSPEMSIS